MSTHDTGAPPLQTLKPLVDRRPRAWAWSCKGCGLTRCFHSLDRAADAAWAHWEEYPCPTLEAYKYGQDDEIRPLGDDDE